MLICLIVFEVTVNRLCLKLYLKRTEPGEMLNLIALRCRVIVDLSEIEAVWNLEMISGQFVQKSLKSECLMYYNSSKRRPVRAFAVSRVILF